MSESHKHTDYSDKRIIFATKHLLLDWPPRNTIQEDKSSVQILCIGENEKDKELFLSKIRRSKDQIESDDKKHITIQTIRFRCNDELYSQTNLILWNVASSARMRVGTINYYQHALGVCLLYNIYDRESFEKIKEIWIHDMHRQGWEGACLLVGIDHDSNVVSLDESHSVIDGISEDMEKCYLNEVIDSIPTYCKTRAVLRDEGKALASKLGLLFMECKLHKLTRQCNSHTEHNNLHYDLIETQANSSVPITYLEAITNDPTHIVYTPKDALSTLLYYAIERHGHSPTTLTSTNSSTLHYRYHQHPPIAPAYLTYFHTCIASSALYCPIYPAVDHLIVETPEVQPLRNELDYTFKIGLIGDSMCGKSAFLNSVAHVPFTEHVASTSGLGFKIRYCKIQWPSSTVTTTSSSAFHELASSQEPHHYKVKVFIWDFSGPARYDHTTHSYYRGMKGFFLTYDVTSRRSFQRAANHWMMKHIEIHDGPRTDLAIVLVGLKVPVHEDYAEFEETLSLQSRREVSYQEGWKLAMEYQIPFIECSAETGKGIEDAYATMVQYLLLKEKELEIANALGLSSQHLADEADRYRRQNRHRQEMCTLV